VGQAAALQAVVEGNPGRVLHRRALLQYSVGTGNVPIMVYPTTIDQLTNVISLLSVPFT
jgi:hypothetical protein